ncbi:hypothetical protein AWE51_25665 [Aquimarina aggregata]|uniref:SMODS and SLOG-associating 2TM effector domain-containing protein n=1 Tax=Aquimarina aggregata TaxID=1642818 RepID=A0A162Z2W6_9FLAO|nr:DUF4231 domain-containing protein [Aquimarina aggregata]KZS39522.1 hypothetical protein AWE51_25665 [Aquimarina aggregata]
MDYYKIEPRTEKEYLETRIVDQIKWYDQKSISNKKWYLSLKIFEIVLALFIPFLTAYITNTTSLLKIIVGIIGIIIAALTGIMTLIKFQENCIEYRTVAESLKLEKFLFLARTGPYKNDKDAFSNFVERFESLISNSTKKWVNFISKNELNDSNNDTSD